MQAGGGGAVGKEAAEGRQQVEACGVIVGPFFVVVPIGVASVREARAEGQVGEAVEISVLGGAGARPNPGPLVGWGKRGSNDAPADGWGGKAWVPP